MMTAARNLDPQAPIYNEEGLIDLRKLRKVLGSTVEETAKLLNLHVSTVKANKTSVRTDSKAKNIKYICELLAQLTDNDSAKMRQWFKGPKIYWQGMTPLDSMLIDNYEAVIKVLRRKVEGEGPFGG